MIKGNKFRIFTTIVVKDKNAGYLVWEYDKIYLLNRRGGVVR
jgi:hypothetical protein